MESLPSKRHLVTRRRSSVSSVASEPVISLSRKTPFTLRSQCARHGSECREGHGIMYQKKLRGSPKKVQKSPLKMSIEIDNSVRKKLDDFLNENVTEKIEETVQYQTLNQTSQISHTLLYKNLQDETKKSYQMNNDSQIPTELDEKLYSTPHKELLPIKLSPLQRSAEKTDYTYAKSLSYRSTVTPGKTVVIPNMARNSLDRNGSASHYDNYSSPELRPSFRTTDPSHPASSKFSKSRGFGYGTDYDSDYELDEKEQYVLKAPPSRNIMSRFAYTSARYVYSKLHNTLFSLSWGVYLITCYSLLLDTSILQSNAVTKLRNICRQMPTRLTRPLLTFFFILPLLLSAGGLLLSALHVPYLSSLDSAVNSYANPSLPDELDYPVPADLASNDNSSPQSAYQNELPSDGHPPLIIRTNHPSESLNQIELANPVPPTHSAKLADDNELSNPVPPPHSAELANQNELDNPVSPSPVVNIQPCPELFPIVEEMKQEIQLTVERELKDTKNILRLLKNNYEEKIADLLQQFDILKAKLVTVELMNKPCYDACRKASPEFVNEVIETKWASLMSDMFDSTGFDVRGFAGAAQLFKDSEPDIQALKEWIKTSETRQEVIEFKLKSIETQMKDREKEIFNQVTSEVERVVLDWEKNMKMTLLQDSKNQVIIEVAKQVKILELKSEGGLGREEVRKLIQAALGLYDSDKTGLADYALEPAGGVVLSTRCTESFSSHRPRISIWGFSLWNEPNNPRVVIQPGIVPGQCWSFRGFDGYFVVQLSRRIIPTAFTLEHIPKRLSPDGRIDSAPKNFSVFGLKQETDTNGTPLGQFTYDNTGEPLQTFQVTEKNPGVFPVVELRVHSNHGNLNYTCLYRFRVHGQVVH